MVFNKDWWCLLIVSLDFTRLIKNVPCDVLICKNPSAIPFIPMSIHSGKPGRKDSRWLGVAVGLEYGTSLVEGMD